MKTENLNEQTESTNAGCLQRLDRRLNLGCGKDLREGYINSDLLGGGVQCDLRKFPWPWPDNYADEILMWNVLEHMPDTEATVMEVLVRLKERITIVFVTHRESVLRWFDSVIKL